MQLVLSNNRVLTYGENFIALGGVVINTETGKKYDNATIAECDCVPSDINDVGYEYHCGEFVPCAPFGKGSGNIAVVCNHDCKSIKDSGIPISHFPETITYSGNALTYTKLPQLVLISCNHNSMGTIYKRWGIIFPSTRMVLEGNESGNPQMKEISCLEGANGTTYFDLRGCSHINLTNVTYHATFIY